MFNYDIFIDEKKLLEKEIHKCLDEYFGWEITLNDIKEAMNEKNKHIINEDLRKKTIEEALKSD